MTDQLQEIFDRSRAEALPVIRPPGVAAVRRTVRRRRRAGTAGVTAAAVVALGVAPVLVKRVTDRQTLPTAPAAGAAYAAVLGGGPRTPAVEEEGRPVYDGYEQRVTVYVPSLTLRMACAGTGGFTVVVEGRPDDQGNPQQLTRAAVTCGARPVAVQREFTLPSPVTSEVVVRLVDAGSAAGGRAEFAYRLTGPRALLGIGPDDPANSPLAALSKPGEVLGEGETGSIAPTYDWEANPPGRIQPVAGREQTLVVACTGFGIVHVQVRDRDDIPVVEHDVPCSWPPERQDYRLGLVEAGTTVRMTYESEEKAAAVYAWAAVTTK